MPNRRYTYSGFLINSIVDLKAELLAFMRPDTNEKVNSFNGFLLSFHKPVSFFSNML